MEEKLVVEFGVEKEVKRNYGYVEKYLTHNGESTQYKAIVKDGELLAIVSRRYTLIENERIIDICKRIADIHGLTMEYVKPEGGTRVHVFLEQENKGVVVHNSVDGSYALRIDAVVKLSPAVRTIVKMRDVEQVYKKHFGSAKIVVDDMDKIVSEILKKADDFKYFLEKLDQTDAADHYEELVILEDLLPKKYVSRALQLITHKTLSGDSITLRRIYERIASDIWTADIDMKTKVQYFDNLNQVMFAITGWE